MGEYDDLFNLDDENSGIFNDDGTKVNPALIKKPSLCVTCKKDGMSGEMNVLCLMTRHDQADDEDEFNCHDYESKF